MSQHVVLRLFLDEAQLLDHLIKIDRERLMDEINHTDRREFREFLQCRENMLEDVLGRLHC